MSDLPTKEQLWASKARQIVVSLEKRPALLFEVLYILSDEYEVLGPWEEIREGCWHRRDIKSRVGASVQKSDDGYGWAIYLNMILREHQSNFTSAQDAKDDVDANLTEMGVVLV